jgi:peptidoglycan/xylan/chitin deacetylase (PgdA/CDA1 family)
MDAGDAQAAFALKVDVDTRRGLRDGVPRLLDLFARRDVRASFFVAMGPDRSGRAVLRVLRQPGFLGKMLRSRAPRLYPIETMLRGTVLPAASVVIGQERCVEEIAQAGHEIGIHGYDHVHWHDSLDRLSAREIEWEVESAAGLFAATLGRRPDCFAAPGWQCTARSMAVTDRLDLRYRSDTRGANPYRPRAGTYLSSTPEIPTTLPTLDEMLGVAGRDVGELTEAYLGWIRGDRLNVHTVHAEIEGGPCLAHLDALLERLRDRLPVRTLGDVASRLPRLEALPVAAVAPGRRPGRGGTVACQDGR